MEKEQALRRYFGHDAFRYGQEAVIDQILSGGDVLCVMPTGAGKSICYQLPAVIFPGITLVISPLISLMKDQVAALDAMGIPAAYVNSSLSQRQCAAVYERALRGKYKILYAAPERLENAEFAAFAQRIKISQIAVDEAHCVSQWGQDFRPGYLRISEFVSRLRERPVVGAFTATATERVKTDIADLLQLRKPFRLTTGFDRPNLRFEVQRPKDKTEWLMRFLAERKEESGIVYCAARKTVDLLWELLTENGINAARYHAGMEDDDRRENQEAFVFDRASVMVATNAFGMGIDKSNVGFVVHYNMPKDLESYYQEAGRAGRDGSAAKCVLLFAPGDIAVAKYFIFHAKENNELSEDELERIQKRDLARLEKMVEYCKTEMCLRKQILRYFGEASADRCGNCGNCSRVLVSAEITTQAQKILSAVARTERQFPQGVGLTQVVRMLHGSRDKKVMELGLHRLSTYGIMKTDSRAQIREYAEHLRKEGYVTVTPGPYPVIRLTDKAKNVLFGGERVFMLKDAGESPESRDNKRGNAVPAVSGEPQQDLLQVLKNVRKTIARRDGVPLYVVFSNAVLENIARREPENVWELMEVNGIGEVKAARYAVPVLQAVQAWKRRKLQG